MSSYFDANNKFQPHTMALELNENLAVGPDHHIWSYDHGVWSSTPEAVERACVRLLRNEFTPARAHTVERSVRHLKTTPEIPDSPIDGEKWYPYVNLQNTMYHWIDDIEEDHHKSFLSTVQLPVMYDREAKCPTFDAWLEEVAHEDMVTLLWQVLGYLLITGNPMHTAFVLVGPGGTGKSTFLRVVEHMLGAENVTAQSLRSLSENRFSTARLFMKQANILGDIDAGYLKDSSTFKAIIGGDRIDAEEKGKTGFGFRPFAVPIFSANKTWKSADDTDGYFRRWIVLPFEHKVDRSKPFDESTLYAEAPGIFNKAMDALRDMCAQTGYDAEGNEVPAVSWDIRGSVREARERFQEDSDPIRQWLASDELVGTDAGDESKRTLRGVVYARYKTWCVDNEIKPKNGPDFYTAMRNLGYKERKAGVWYLLGIDVYVPGTVPA